MAGRRKFEADTGDVESPETAVVSVAWIDANLPTAPTPDAAVRDAHAALTDAINAARLAGFDVSGNLDRIIISQTGRA